MGQTLLLNATFEPLCIVSARRAVVLILSERAESVVDGDAAMHSERCTVSVPSVARLIHFVRVPFRSRVPLSRRAVFARDGFRCQYCGGSAENIDHVVPRSRGGQHVWENVVAACRACNARKEDRLPAEFGIPLRRVPVQPHAHVWLLAHAGRVDPAWREFLAGSGDDFSPLERRTA
ncbi:MAG: HNH endonuclease [Acidimicrobiia bacterium]